jgi:hypothetical protein
VPLSMGAAKNNPIPQALFSACIYIPRALTSPECICFVLRRPFVLAPAAEYSFLNFVISANLLIAAWNLLLYIVMLLNEMYQIVKIIKKLSNT